MLKLKLSLIFGYEKGNTEVFYCKDEDTNKFYKRTITKGETSITEIIQEIEENEVENFVVENKDALFELIGIK